MTANSQGPHDVQKFYNSIFYNYQQKRKYVWHMQGDSKHCQLITYIKWKLCLNEQHKSGPESASGTIQHTSPADTPFARVLRMTLVRCEPAVDGLSRTGLSRALAGRFTIEPPAATPARKPCWLAAETTTPTAVVSSEENNNNNNNNNTKNYNANTLTH